MRPLAVVVMALGSVCCGSAAFAAGANESPQALALAQAAFAHPAAFDSDPIGTILDRKAVTSAGDVRWGSGEARLGQGPGGVFDTLRVTLGQTRWAPGGLPLHSDHADYEAQSYEVAVVRHWPGAVSLQAGSLGLDVTPHAGLGLANGHGSAEAGLQVSRSHRFSEAAAEKLKELGVRDGASFGDRGRWYLFAAASGRSVGLNMLRQGGGWDRAGWSTEPASALVGDAQVGVGWRQGDTQTSFGFVHREIKSPHTLRGVDPHSESMVALSLSIRPR